MIKQTLYFGNPAYISTKNAQLVIKIKKDEKEHTATRPIEDIAVIILDHGRITITHNAIKRLQENKVAIISCDDKHMPGSLMLPLVGHSEQTEKYRYQISASAPLKKNLWQQTVIAKIKNQLSVLDKLDRPATRLTHLLNKVQSGDPQNIEAQAAAYYWKTYIDGFVRDRLGGPPNNLLNYGYAILRAMTARSLVSSGHITSLGIHHRNKYNPYCLADDIMEPYRPFVDLVAYQMYTEEKTDPILNISNKARLLRFSTMDAVYENKKSPLMVGIQMTTASLAACFKGEKRKINYPVLE